MKSISKQLICISIILLFMGVSVLSVSAELSKPIDKEIFISDEYNNCLVFGSPYGNLDYFGKRLFINNDFNGSLFRFTIIDLVHSKTIRVGADFNYITFNGFTGFTIFSIAFNPFLLVQVIFQLRF